MFHEEMNLASDTRDETLIATSRIFPLRGKLHLPQYNDALADFLQAMLAAQDVAARCKELGITA